MERAIMCKTQIFVFSVISILCFKGDFANAGPFRQDPGPNGIVSMEAENYDDNVPQGEHRWVLVGPTDGFTGDAGMMALPNILVNNTTDYVTKSPRLDYKVDFVKTGTHYIWLRVWANDGSDDSCHAGLDFQAINTCDGIDGFDNTYVWTNSTIDGPVPTFEVASPGLHTFNIWMREDGCIVDKIVLTTNPDYAPEDNGPLESIREPDSKATDPDPADGAKDVSRDINLSWTPGDFARTHDIYFGPSFNDVNDAGVNNPLDVLAKQGQDVNTYTPGRLDFEQTYYWRIDEVNAPSAPTTFKGFVWSFTTESYVYPLASVKITVTASGQTQNQVPENTVNDSGLNADLQHSTDLADMWLSSAGDPGTAWIQYEFDKPYKLHEMWIWNYNGPFVFSGFGIKEAIIEYSTDGTNWTQLGEVHEFDKATGMDTYTYNTIVDFNDLAVKAVIITANSSWGGAMFNQYGLSEVRFMQIPVQAAGPEPQDGATNVAHNAILSWRAGREAAEHKVYLSTDRQAVLDGTAPVVTISQTMYGPLSLELAKTYYWRVDEVNNAEASSLWQGDIWSFTTSESIIVDDFESYNDIEAGQAGSNLVYLTWIDGYDNPSTNGSTIGYLSGNSLETMTVHGGRQSVPFSYNNTTASYSQATADTTNLVVGPDWTIGAPEKLMIWFYGDPNNSATDRMYAKVNNTKVLYDGDLTQTDWQEFQIDLAALGIDLSNVMQLAIGFERTGATGGSGIVFIDDIMLYSPLDE
jgi:hypothetical protein